MTLDKIYNKNDKKIIIPDGVTTIPDEAFIDFEALEEVIIPDSVIYIGKAAFKGCKSLKKVKLSNNLQVLDNFAFSECESLEEISIPSSLHYYSHGVFSHCYNLKNIYSHDNINYIDDLAFYNCKSLDNFDISDSVTSIGRMAFMGCESITHVHITKNVNCIEVGAFALMSSLEKITVDNENEKYLSYDDDTILLSKDGLILQYAINCNREEFVCEYYGVPLMGSITVNNENIILPEIYSLTYNIADYAFAGAKKLKKFYMSSVTESIGANTFFGCDNLKDLEIFHSNYGDSFLLHIFKSHNEDVSIPFENIVIKYGIKTICENTSDLFMSAKEVELPSSLEHIGSNVFSKSIYLKELDIPVNIKMIGPNTFYHAIKLHFADFMDIIGRNFNMLQTKRSDNFDISSHDRDIAKILSLTDGTYYIKIDDYDMLKINRNEIINLSSTSYMVANTPYRFTQYLRNLLGIYADSNHLLTSIFADKNLEDIFKRFVNDIPVVSEIAHKKNSDFIREILDNSGIHDEFLFNGILMRKIGKTELLKILENYNLSLNRFFKFSSIDKVSDVDNLIIDIDKLVMYCNLLEKYKQYDRFLYNPIFFQKLSSKNAELLIKYFNKNIKNLIKNSGTLDDFYGRNLNDLLDLCNALGVFSSDEILSQRLCTFINDKILSEEINGNPNNFRIIDNDIHTKFGEISPRDTIDYEFINFFIENYEHLFNLENENSGIIARIYNSFRDISRTSTSHRGSQRHLKVTLDKCLNYFLTQRFDGVTEENEDLANFLQSYYSEPYTLGIGESIVKESLNAPRNIFSKINYDDCDDPIYSYNPDEDLRENNINDFSYEWLPKQDYNNLILGKYCSCCAHILGAGAGIMRASMVLDHCQNLVIRNKINEIIAKMTIYVNREKGYAVFNTAEVNSNYRDDEFLTKIHAAFMRGTNAFIEKYNSNNEIQISIISIGEYRNLIKHKLGNIETILYETPDYSAYGYYAGKEFVGTYNGDSKKKQILVLKK